MLSNKHDEKANVLVYLVTDLLAKGIPFLLLPIYTIFLRPEQFGNIALFNVIVEVLIILVVFGANSYYRVEFFKQSNRPLLFTQLFNNIVLCFPVALLLMVAFTSLELNPGNHSNSWLFAAVLIALSQSIILMFIANYQCEGRALGVGFLNLSAAVIAAGVTIVLLNFDFQESSRYWGYLVASLSVAILAIGLNRKGKLEWHSRRKGLSLPALRFGAGVLPHALSWWARTGMDRFIIAKFVSIYQVGLYAISAQLSLIVIVFANAVNQAFTPKIIKMLTAKAYMKTLQLCLAVIGLYLMICVVIALMSPVIFSMFIDEKFSEAQALLPLMCAVAFFQATVTLFSNFLYFFKQVKTLSFITFLTSALHVVIAFNVVTPYGVEGVIYSSIATYILSAIAIVAISMWLIKRELNEEN